MFKIVITDAYHKRAEKFLKKHPEVKEQYKKTLKLLETNPFHPSLRLHSFKTNSFNGYSVSINMSYRIAIEFLIIKNEIVPVYVGDHKTIYGKD